MRTLRPRRRASRRILAVSLVLGVAATVAPAASGAPAVPAAVPAPLVLTAAQVPGDQVLEVVWQYGAGDPPTSIRIELFLVQGGVPKYISGTTVRQTIEPMSYEIPVYPGVWQVKTVPIGTGGFGHATWTAPVTVVNGCDGAALCAAVAPSPDAGTVGLVGQGFLMGLGQQVSPALDALVRPLQPRQWRFSGPWLDALTQPFGVSRTQILSDLWFKATAPTNLGYAKTPWSNWDAWGTFVALTVQRAIAEGWAPDYWDVWNEPNGTCCPKFQPLELQTITTERWLITYEVAWRAIKAIDPDAKIIGPSTSSLQWTDEQAPNPAPELDLDTFLQYAADKGLVWDAVSWHESTLVAGWGDMGYGLANVDRHLAMAREVIDNHPGTVVDDKIFINEYGAPEVHMLAGWTVGFLRAFEDAGVAEANRSCWDEAECATGMLSGLLTAAGQPTAQWWTHRLYADLEGQTRMAVTSNSSWQLDGLATQDDPSRTVNVLLGRHWYCNKAVNWWCPFGWPVAPQSVHVTIDWPYGLAPVAIAVSRLPAGVLPLVAPQPILTQTVVPANGQIMVTIPGVVDGDALSIVATSTGPPLL